MTKPIEFLFDFGSPTTFLAHKRIPGVVARTGARVDYVPMLLGGVFKATGNASPAAVPAKGRYTAVDMQRFAQRHGIVLKPNPFFPVNTLVMMRMAAGLKDGPRFAAFVDAMFDAMWVEARNMGDPAELAAVLTASGLDTEEMLVLAQSDAAKTRLKSATEDAVARGAFGAPTFFVGGQMFFGQDRLDWVEEAASA